MQVRLDKLLFATHDMNWKHVDRWLGVPTSERPPLLVEPLPFGYFFVHDGRHRATAAYEDNQILINAKLVNYLED